MISVEDPYGHILGFLRRSRYFFFQIAPQLYSGKAEWTLFNTNYFSENLVPPGTRTFGSVARNSDHRGGQSHYEYERKLLLVYI
jgi:hypothetical protein